MRTAKPAAPLVSVAAVLAMTLAPAASASSSGVTTEVSGDRSWVNTNWAEKTLHDVSILATGDEVGT